MAKKTVALRHVTLRNDQVFAFYDGVVQAKGGVLTLPAEREDWIRRAWVSGYSISPDDGRRITTWADLMAEVQKQNTESVESAESEESDEDTGTGRQSEVEDGLRESEPESGDSAPKRRTRRSRNRSADDGEATTEE